MGVMEIATERSLKFVEEVYLQMAEIHNSLIFLRENKQLSISQHKFCVLAKSK